MLNSRPSKNTEYCSTGKQWFLEGYFLADGEQIRLGISELPIVLGRSESSRYSINHPSVSRTHAELTDVDGCISISDLDSRNGTYVNYYKVSEPTKLHPGDFVHIGSCEFRVIAENETLDEHRAADDTWVMKDPGGVEFQTMLNDEAVNSIFQPLVFLEDSAIFGYETLGRGNFPGAPSRPEDLFRIARRYGYSQTLSNVFRVKALRTAEFVPHNCQIFINIHGDELRESERFIGEMAKFHDLYPAMSLVAEIPESLMVSTSTLQNLKSGLGELGYGIAFDDFGAGQCRLLQLCKCPPNYLKFDRAFVAGIDSAPAAQQRLLRSLVEFADDYGIVTVAEGVETQAESDTCRQMGFKCGQGYLYGKPMSAEEAFAIS